MLSNTAQDELSMFGYVNLPRTVYCEEVETEILHLGDYTTALDKITVQLQIRCVKAENNPNGTSRVYF